MPENNPELAPVENEPVVVTPAPEAPRAENDLVTPPQAEDEGTDGEPKPVVAAIEPKAEEAPKPKPGKSLIDRVGQLTREKAELKRQLEAVTKPAPVEPVEGADTGVPKNLSPEELDRYIDERASIKAAQATYNARANSLVAAGDKEFGRDDFTAKSNILWSLGVSEKPEFMQIVTDPDLMPDGHKVIAHLADNHDDALRILSLPPLQMAAALTKLGDKISAAPQTPQRTISNAPRPITPVDGTARGNDEPADTDDMATFAQKWQAKQAKKANNGMARF